MKISLILATAAMMAVAVSAQVSTRVSAQDPAPSREKPQGAHFAFYVTEHDFGSVPHSSPRIEHRFAFTNDGTAPLVITRAATSCSCVKVSYDKRPVPPGGKGEVQVVYEVNKKEAGVFYKAIEIYSNTPEKRHSLIVKGNAVTNTEQ